MLSLGIVTQAAKVVVNFDPNLLVHAVVLDNWVHVR